LQVLGSDPNVLVGSIAARLDELDVHELVTELVERDAGRHLRSVRRTWTRRTDDGWREDERPRTEPRTGHERVGEQNRGQDDATATPSWDDPKQHQ
jgi:hypothetical protein